MWFHEEEKKQTLEGTVLGPLPKKVVNDKFRSTRNCEYIPLRNALMYFMSRICSYVGLPVWPTFS